MHELNEHEAEWKTVIATLSYEAGRRGGTVALSTEFLRLEPPANIGEPIEITHYDDGTNIIEGPFCFQVAVSSVDSTVAVAVAIMDGGATETIEIAVDGTWLGVRSLVKLDDGGEIEHGRNSHRASPHHTHSRRIPHWPPHRHG
jgi:hypothetical protein